MITLSTEVFPEGIKVSDITRHVIGMIMRNVEGSFWYLDDDLITRINACGWSIPRNEFQSLNGIKYYILAMEYEALATGY